MSPADRRSIQALFGLLLALAPVTPTHAQGIALGWGACVADGGQVNVNFACDTNAPTRALAPSFVLPSAMAGVGSVQGVVDIVADAATLPAWWEFTGCRSGSLQYTPTSVGPILCTLWNDFATIGGINSFVVGTTGPNTARITFTSFAGITGGRSLTAGTEYVVTGLVVNSTRTAGVPSCSGCGTGVCLTLSRLTISAPTGSIAMTAAFPGSHGVTVTWQGGGSGPGGTCAAATPTRGSTWGAVKSLYR